MLPLWMKTVKKDSALAKGVNVFGGYVTNLGVAKAHGLEYRALEELIEKVEENG